jgi:integrase
MLGRDRPRHRPCYSYTGLRLGDLIRVAWSHVGDEAIVLTTGKSRHRREAIIPLYGALHDVLARIPKRATTILTSSRNRPWTADGFGSSFNKAKSDAGMSERDLHFNDLRGTAATKFYIAGFTMREIAETLAWEESSVEKIIRRYVSRSAAIKARIRKLEARE